jgi:hypothetical protein
MSQRNIDKNPAYDERAFREKKEAVELCGKNRGPHDYIPIEWLKTATSERVTRMMCRICFNHITMMNILENSREVSY